MQIRFAILSLLLVAILAGCTAPPVHPGDQHITTYIYFIYGTKAEPRIVLREVRGRVHVQYYDGKSTIYTQFDGIIESSVPIMSSLEPMPLDQIGKLIVAPESEPVVWPQKLSGSLDRVGEMGPNSFNPVDDLAPDPPLDGVLN